MNWPGVQQQSVMQVRGETRFFYGWVVVATAALGLFLGGFPISVASFGMFFPAYLRDFHAGRAAISLAFTAHNAVGSLAIFAIGRLSDRFRVRTVIVLGTAALGVILLSANLIGSRVGQLYLLYGLLGAAGAATTSVPYALVVSRWFNRRRGLALGLMMAGMGAGAIIVPLIAQRLIVVYGWRTTLGIFGYAVLMVPIPVVAIFLKERPEQMGLLPDGVPLLSEANASREGFSWSEIWRSRAYWLMTTGFVLVGASVQACVVHLPQLIADRHGSTGAAAMAASVAGLALFLGRFGTGYFLDLYFAPRVAALLFAGAAMGVLLIWTGGASAVVWAGAFLIGLAFGAEGDVIAYLMGRYFGLRSLGVAFGFAFGAFVLGGGMGSLLMDFAFDHAGSYAAAFGVSMLLTLLSAVLVGSMGPYRFGVKGNA